jgi:hypothetical protein
MRIVQLDSSSTHPYPFVPTLRRTNGAAAPFGVAAG